MQTVDTYGLTDEVIQDHLYMSASYSAKSLAGRVKRGRFDRLQGIEFLKRMSVSQLEEELMLRMYKQLIEEYGIPADEDMPQ